MSVLEIPPQEASPYVRFDPDQGILLIKGKSYDEDVFMLFSLLRGKLRTYAESKPEKLDVHIFLTYFNTSASKCLFDLLSILKNIQASGMNLSVLWNFVEGDDAMGEEIEDIQDALSMQFDIRASAEYDT